MVKMQFQTIHTTFNLGFANYDDAVQFLEGYIGYEHNRAAQINFSVDLKEVKDDNQSIQRKS